MASTGNSKLNAVLFCAGFMVVGAIAMLLYLALFDKPKSSSTKTVPGNNVRVKVYKTDDTLLLDLVLPRKEVMATKEGLHLYLSKQLIGDRTDILRGPGSYGQIHISGFKYILVLTSEPVTDLSPTPSESPKPQSVPTADLTPRWSGDFETR